MGGFFIRDPRQEILLESASVAAQERMAKINTGRRILHIEIPDARSAMASLSEDIRLNAVSIPTSTAIGIVTVRTAGSRAATTAQISDPVGD